MEFVSKPEEANVILFGAPIDQGTENHGCIDAPSKVREFIDNFFLSEKATVNNILDKGDIVEEKNFEQTMDKLFNKTVEFLKMGKPIVCIGGNHSITLPIVQALSRFYYNIGVIHLDAHPDCQIDYYPYGDVIGAIFHVPEVKKIISIGLRNWSKNEYQFLMENKIQFITASELVEKGNSNIMRIIEDSLKKCDCVYITFDIDFVDPAFAPGTGWLEPGGPSSRQTIDLLQKLAQLTNVKGMDLVEVNPKHDINNMTSVLAAKSIFEFVDSLKI